MVVTNGTKLKVINSNYIPDIIYINGIKSSIDNSGYVNIENGPTNYLTMQWNKKEEKYSKLFQNIETAIEIDLSKFDISGIGSIKSMFVNCINLKY